VPSAAALSLAARNANQRQAPSTMAAMWDKAMPAFEHALDVPPTGVGLEVEGAEPAEPASMANAPAGW
jgi:hypothetical protein